MLPSMKATTQVLTWKVAASRLDTARYRRLFCRVYTIDGTEILTQSHGCCTIFSLRCCNHFLKLPSYNNWFMKSASSINIKSLKRFFSLTHLEVICSTLKVFLCAEKCPCNRITSCSRLPFFNQIGLNSIFCGWFQNVSEYWIESLNWIILVLRRSLWQQISQKITWISITTRQAENLRNSEHMTAVVDMNISPARVRT